MGFMDTLFGSAPDAEFRHKRTGQQVNMGSSTYKLLKNLFSPGGFMNLLPTREAMQAIDPSVYGGAHWGIEQGANQLQERLAGMGFSGGSGASAMGEYYANTQPQIYSMLAGLVSGAQRMPYQMAAGLWPSTQQNTAMPIVSGGSQGLLPGLISAAAPLVGMGMFGPMGALAGGMLGGSIGGMHGNLGGGYSDYFTGYWPGYGG